MLSTQPQRRYIEFLTKGMTLVEISAIIKQAGHTGEAAYVTDDNVKFSTANQMLTKVTKAQASKIISLLKK